jgi:hypothetical protein
MPGDFLMATLIGPKTQYGRVASGLAMTMLWEGSPKGKRPPAWSLTHLGTGHRVCVIEACEAEAFQIATEILVLTDWGFDGLLGWQNQDPKLIEKLDAMRGRYPKALHPRSGSVGCHEAAVAIAEARA